MISILMTCNNKQKHKVIHEFHHVVGAVALWLVVALLGKIMACVATQPIC